MPDLSPQRNDHTKPSMSGLLSTIRRSTSPAPAFLQKSSLPFSCRITSNMSAEADAGRTQGAINGLWPLSGDPIKPYPNGFDTEWSERYSPRALYGAYAGGLDDVLYAVEIGTNRRAFFTNGDDPSGDFGTISFDDAIGWLPAVSVVPFIPRRWMGSQGFLFDGGGSTSSRYHLHMVFHVYKFADGSSKMPSTSCYDAPIRSSRVSPSTKPFTFHKYGTSVPEDPAQYPMGNSELLTPCNMRNQVDGNNMRFRMSPTSQVMIVEYSWRSDSTFGPYRTESEPRIFKWDEGVTGMKYSDYCAARDLTMPDYDHGRWSSAPASVVVSSVRLCSVSVSKVYSDPVPDIVDSVTYEKMVPTVAWSSPDTTLRMRSLNTYGSAGPCQDCLEIDCDEQDATASHLTCPSNDWPKSAFRVTISGVIGADVNGVYDLRMDEHYYSYPSSGVCIGEHVFPNEVYLYLSQGECFADGPQFSAYFGFWTEKEPFFGLNPGTPRILLNHAYPNYYDAYQEGLAGYGGTVTFEAMTTMTNQYRVINVCDNPASVIARFDNVTKCPWASGPASLPSSVELRIMPYSELNGIAAGLYEAFYSFLTSTFVWPIPYSQIQDGSQSGLLYAYSPSGGYTYGDIDGTLRVTTVGYSQYGTAYAGATLPDGAFADNKVTVCQQPGEWWMPGVSYTGGSGSIDAYQRVLACTFTCTRVRDSECLSSGRVDGAMYPTTATLTEGPNGEYVQTASCFGMNMAGRTYDAECSQRLDYLGVTNGSGVISLIAVDGGWQIQVKNDLVVSDGYGGQTTVHGETFYSDILETNTGLFTIETVYHFGLAEEILLYAEFDVSLVYAPNAPQ